MAGQQSFRLDSDWPDIQRALRRYGPEAKKEMNRTIRRSANTIKAEAARGFRTYSSRVHKALGVQVTAKHVAVVLSSRKVAHAVISEKGGRHPVYGNRRVWVQHPARPELEPAVERNRKKVRDDIEDAVIRAARDVRVIK